MFPNNLTQLVLYFALALSMVSCTIPLRTVVHGPLDTTAVPMDFNPERDLLLVAAVPGAGSPDEEDQKRTKKLDEELRKQYPYPYRIVSQKALLEKGGPYSDTLLFRFALLLERNDVQQPASLRVGPDDGFALTPGYRSTLVDFAFYDRYSRQRLPHSGNGTSVMRIAVANLTAMVQKAKQRKATAVASLPSGK